MTTKKAVIPANAKRVPLRPLALGEKTGHHHSLATLDETPLEDKVEMYEMEDGKGNRVFLRVTGEGVALLHQEHKAQPVEIGDHEVIIQTAVTDWGRAAVTD